MIRKTIQVDIPSCQQAKFLRCSLAINYHLFNSTGSMIIRVTKSKRKPYYKLLKKYSNSFDETALIYAHFGDGPIIFKTINYVVSVYCV